MIHYIKAAASSGDNHYMVTSLFAEEVLDIGEGMSGLDDQLTREMMRWSSEEQGLRKASESMPSVLASLKASQTDPRLFTGKPIIAPPSINVSNKHLEYVYTWFSLAALLLVSLKLGKF
jgi:cytochrome oxidase assembly protein ShyY1